MEGVVSSEGGKPKTRYFFRESNQQQPKQGEGNCGGEDRQDIGKEGEGELVFNGHKLLRWGNKGGTVERVIQKKEMERGGGCVSLRTKKREVGKKKE